MFRNPKQPTDNSAERIFQQWVIINKDIVKIQGGNP